jgi:hypothetical protein
MNLCTGPDTFAPPPCQDFHVLKGSGGVRETPGKMRSLPDRMLQSEFQSEFFAIIGKYLKQNVK